MPNIRALLDARVSAAIAAAYPEAADAPAIVQPAQNPDFGDYQANGAMALAKRLKTNPREVAAKVVEQLRADAQLAAMVDTEKKEQGGEPEPGIALAGPGFINLRLRPEWVAAQLGKVNADVADGSGTRPEGEERLGVEAARDPETVVVDYSAPNLAKEMHVGHLRSTIIGDALVRMLDFAGHNVQRQNHVGDWGTQFGMIILSCWHRCMAEEREGEDSDYIQRTLDALKGLSTDDPLQVREKALRPICDLHQHELDKDPDGIVHFDSWVDGQTQQNRLAFDQLEEGYRFVNRVESLAEGTDLTITHRPSDEEPVTTPLAKVSSRITAVMQARGKKNEQELKAWRYARRLSLGHINKVYARLGVLLTDNDVRGESAYNGVLLDIVRALDEQGLLTESEGARCVFLKDAAGKPLFANKDGDPLPLIVQKADEGYLYPTTDLAAIAFRTGNLPEIRNPKSEIRNETSPKADRILYVVDARQSLHFRMVFECACQAGFADRERHDLVHVAFGTMMGADGKPFKTREGGTVKLMDLLDEAEGRARDLVETKQADLPDDQPGLSEEEKGRIAHIVGIGGVKYADLAQNRTSDYVFSWDKMLSLQGNTAPYMQYAYARVRSIFQKGFPDEAERERVEADLRRDASPVPVDDPAEAALAKMLLRFPETLDRALADYRPNVLAAYLFDLAQAFTAFYDACPVLKSDEETRRHRLRLCLLTARIIAKGLALLGIETAERM